MYNRSNEPEYPMVPYGFEQEEGQNSTDSNQHKVTDDFLYFLISVAVLYIFLGPFVDEFKHLMSCYMIISA